MENSSLETVSGNESSGMTASFGNDSKHARNSETAKNCLTTVSGENYASSSMMMIAFITIKCSLVPLIEGLCA
jgi:hypothetical protein